MKNARDWQIKNCIFMSTEEYDAIIKQLFGSDVQVEFSMDGIWIGSDDPCNEITFDDINKGLSEYFDVTEVTSVHIDDCDEIGVWICYK